MMYHQPLQQGYSLVETLIAISVLLIALTTPITIVTSSLRSALYVNEQTTALFLAQEGIEAVHAYRNSHVIDDIVNNGAADTWDWVNDSVLNDCFDSEGCNIDTDGPQPFTSGGVVSCASIGDCVLEIDDSPSRSKYVLQTVGDQDSIYTRVIQLDPINVSGPGISDPVKVTVTVSWEARLFAGDVREVVLENVLYDLYDN